MSFKLQDLLAAIAVERKKTKSDEDDEFILVQESGPEWQRIFDIYFLSPTTRLAQTSTSTTSDDDLVFYVTRRLYNDLQNPPHSIDVFRHHDTKRQPKLGSPEYDWEETTNLNLVLHQFEYTVTTAVCTKPGDKHLQIIKRLSTRVYASPSRRDMENKGTEEKLTYPNMYFTVDNFEDTFCEMVVNEGQMVCVELVAKNPTLNQPRVLFLAAIRYDALRKVYDTRATKSDRVAQRVSLGMFAKHRVEFIKMRGPNGKGHAEMAVSKHRPNQPSGTPTKSNAISPPSPNSDEGNGNTRRTSENSSPRQSMSPATRQQPDAAAAAAEVDSSDVNSDLSDDAGGFLGRTLNHAMNWVRNSNVTLDPSTQVLPLQTCLTYLTLPCNYIVKDILESNSVPMLTPTQSK